MHPEADRVVVPVVQGEPGKRLIAPLQLLPGREQGRFAGSRWSGEKRQLVLTPRKLLEKSGAGDEGASHRGRLEFLPDDDVFGNRRPARQAPPSRALCRCGIHRTRSPTVEGTVA